MARRWSWPTGEGWTLACFMLVIAYAAGEWRGVGIMGGFLVFINVVGNLTLPRRK